MVYVLQKLTFSDIQAVILHIHYFSKPKFLKIAYIVNDRLNN